ncbi:XK-related protein 9 [Hyperolius riggenbachi]|uniref:XK-related protein 9 n=1 Tax=Hyperolius riggenbachi TaxID=752182 RepID=UPI0035A2CDA9
MGFMHNWFKSVLPGCWRMSFTKWNFLMTIFGVFTFLADIGLDLWITFKYFQEGVPAFGLLTIFFVIWASLIIQAFSYTWFQDDCDEHSCPKKILILHVFQLGTFVRYWYVLKYGYKVNCKCNAKKTNWEETKTRAVEAMTDLSMLRCFKTYLESTPQLILQLYILMTHKTITIFQYASILVSVTSISWSTIDYQMSLRKSLPGKKGIGVGAPMLFFLFYKFFTLTSWILSIVLLLYCNIHIFTALLVMLFVAGVLWACKVQTEFCKTLGMEFLYRAVVGIILIFTFFNVKGSRTLLPISIYYVVRTLTTAGILVLTTYLRPNFVKTVVFAILSIAVVVALGFGILSLILYYGCFHPSLQSGEGTIEDESGGDAVDGPSIYAVVGSPSRTRSPRIQKFIMP